MAQPTETRRAVCPVCRRQLYLVLLRPDGQHAQASELPELGMDVSELKKPIYRSDDMTTPRLWVPQREHLREKLGDWEEISGAGHGPDGNAPGAIECDIDGPLDYGDLRAYYEKVGF